MVDKRQVLIAGNWKLNGSRASVETLSESVARSATTLPAEVVLCPSTVHLSDVLNVIGNTAIKLGAQDCSEHSGGAFTGECSADMLEEFGCEYVIVGHSERRALFGDTDKRVAAKFDAVQKASMTPIVCVGESLPQREADLHNDVIAGQLDAILTGGGQDGASSGISRLCNAVIAYEPIWAIGTGKTASPDQAQEVHAMIRDKIRALDADIAAQLRIIYGGSVNPANAEALFSQRDIDGALVGGASLKAADFVAVCLAG